jgi:hypothetical protein
MTPATARQGDDGRRGRRRDERAAAALARSGLTWDGLRAALALGPADGMLLTGSLVLPFDVASDDFDLVILKESSALEHWEDRRHSERITEQHANGYLLFYARIGESEVDGEVWPQPTLGRALAAMPSSIADVDTLESAFTRFAGLERKVGVDLFHALLWGVPEPRSEALVARVRAAVNWTVFHAWNRDFHLINVRDAIKGVTKSLKDGAVEEAYLKMRWAADNVVDATIFHCGLSINRWKWRVRYLPLLAPWLGEWYRAVHFSPFSETAAPFADWLAVLRDRVRLLGREPRLTAAGSAPAPEEIAPWT